MGRFVATNGIRLHVLEHTGDSPPLVLMPGMAGNAHFFDAVVAERPGPDAPEDAPSPGHPAISPG